MALIPNPIIRITLAYKLSVIIAFAIAACCFFWDLYTHELLMETQAELRQAQKNVSTVLEVMRTIQKECKDGSK